MSNINIPSDAKEIISTLEQSGFEAYVVGGCVRDSLLGLEPHDWDICTSATPEKVMSCFSRKKIVGTGMKHGTVTVLTEDNGYEVTTFRIDGGYSDRRRPDNVMFTTDICKDLARRDFTMNAIAYNDHTGLIDPFGGKKALRDRVISCVGNPSDRFGEDALRIMRALRFASTYGFCIDSRTEAAIHQLAPTLCNISSERINTELCKLLCGRGVLDVLLNYSDVITNIIPELAPCVGFEQNNPYHQYNVYDHIAHAVANYKGDDISVKVALLLHDIGKPQCYTEDERGGHFYGHSWAQCPSHDIADVVTKRLRFDNKTRNEVLDLVLYHDSVIEPTPKTVRRWLNKIGEARFRQLLQVRMADIKAHAEGTQKSRIERCLALGTILDEVIVEEQCFSMKDLAISGRDILSLGIPQGKRVGMILQHLLDMVIDTQLSNEPSDLINEAQRYIEEESQ